MTEVFKTFLVTGANGDIGDAIGRILKNTWPNATIVGIDYRGVTPASARFDFAFRAPNASDDQYLPFLSKLAKTHSVELIIPTSEAEILRLVQDDVGKWQLPILVNPSQIVSTFTDKLKTMEWLEKIGVRIPRTVPFEQSSETDLPLVAKPIRGQGSKGIYILQNKQDLEYFQSKCLENYVGQQYLPDENEERTCAIIKVAGSFRHLVMKRKLVGGMSSQIEIEAHKPIDDLLAKIAIHLPDNTAVNVQLRVVEGTPMVFEINPRFSSTVMMRHLLGFSDLVWMINALKGIGVPLVPSPVGAQVFRMSEELVIHEKA